MFILVQKLQVNNMITVRNPPWVKNFGSGTRGWEWEKGGKERGRGREREAHWQEEEFILSAN